MLYSTDGLIGAEMFQRQRQPAEPQESPQLPVEMHEVPTAHAILRAPNRRVGVANAEFDSHTWPLLIVGDVSQRARTRLPAGLVDASLADLEAAYVRGEIPYIPFAPSVELAEVVIAKQSTASCFSPHRDD